MPLERFLFCSTPFYFPRDQQQQTLLYHHSLPVQINLTMEAFLKSVEAEDLASAFADLGTESVGDIAICEPDDLISDLNLSKEKADEIVKKAKDAMLFEKRKFAIQGSWKAVEDALAVEATKLFYSRLFEKYPSVKPLFESVDMDAQAEKL